MCLRSESEIVVHIIKFKIRSKTANTAEFPVLSAPFSVSSGASRLSQRSPP